MDVGELAAEYQRSNCHQFDQNVQSGARGVLEWVADCIANYTGFVDVSAFEDYLTLVVLHRTAFDVLFGVVPGTSSVGSRNSELDSADDGSGKEPC